MTKSEANKLAGIPKQSTRAALKKKLDNNDSNLTSFDHLTSPIDTNGTQSADANVRNEQVVKSENDVSISDIEEEQEEPRPVWHPNLPICTPPRYFVNKQGIVYSKRYDKLKPLKRQGISYVFTHQKRSVTVRLVEIMIYTFREQAFDPSVDYIYYKDGDNKNCVWDNLIICNLPKLQQLEIQRLEKLHPGTKYTVVNNLHSFLTFDHYLVSDAGKVFSLLTFSQLKPTNDRGWLCMSLQNDADHGLGIVKRTRHLLHSIVYQSFNGSRKPDLLIIHGDGNRMNNTLDNLKCLTRSQNITEFIKKKKTQGHRIIQNQMPQSGKLLPQPPFSDDITWKPVGMVLGKEWLFNQYQVSNMGHVRDKTSEKLHLQYATNTGHVVIHLRRDLQGVTDTDNLDKKKGELVQVSHLVASVFVEGYCKEKNEVAHLNGDPLDNRAENLCWKTRTVSRINKRAYRVVVTLVDDANLQKEFPSVERAQRELSIKIGYKCAGRSFKEEVNWDGEQKQVMIEVFKPIT